MGRMPSTASATTCELLTRIATGDDEQAAWAELSAAMAPRGMPKDGGGLDQATIAKVREFNPATR